MPNEGMRDSLTNWWTRFLSMFKSTPPMRTRLSGVTASGVMPRGSVISCPNDHWLYRLSRDIHPYKGEIMKSTDAERFDELMPEPKPGDPVQIRCAYCGEKWRRRVGIGSFQTHFTTGWWPTFPDVTP